MCVGPQFGVVVCREWEWEWEWVSQGEGKVSWEGVLCYVMLLVVLSTEHMGVCCCNV